MGNDDTPPIETHPLSIVSLDDDDDFRQYIRSVIESDGHECRVAATPEIGRAHV